MDPTTQTVILAVSAFFGGGVVVFILTGIKDYMTREKKWLGVQLESKCLVHRDDPELKITYKDKEVSRIVLHNLRFRNLGNRALTDLPLILHPPSGMTGYKAAAGSTDGVSCEYFADARGLGVKFDLLKPGDEATVAFSVFDCPDEELKIFVKQENVELKTVSDTDSASNILDIFVQNSGGVTRAVFQLTSLLLKR
jgi:hypothetical protein